MTSSPCKELAGAEIVLSKQVKLDQYASMVADKMKEMFDYQEERLMAYLEGRMPRVTVCACCDGGSVLCTCKTFHACGCEYSCNTQVERYQCFGKVLVTLQAVREAAASIKQKSKEDLRSKLKSEHGERGDAALRFVYDIYYQKISNLK
jgi:hypothetical protein